MRTCVFILPVLWLGCGFEASPLVVDHDTDPRIWTSDGVVTIRESDGAAAFHGHDATTAGSGEPEDATVAPDAELDAAAPTMDAAPVDAAPDSTVPDNDSSPPDAAQPPPDAAPDASPPDAAPSVDARVPDYTDDRICQQCGAEFGACGPQSVCTTGVFSGMSTVGLCLPKAPVGKSCADVCRGYLPSELANGGCGKMSTLDIGPSCTLVTMTQACWN